AACADAGGACARPSAGAPTRHRAAPRQARDASARCGTGRARRRERVMDPVAARRRSILWRARGANLFGAVMAFAYFRYLDPVTSAPEVTWAEIVFAAGVFIALTVTGARGATRWAAPMFTRDPGSSDVRRRALLFPWVSAGSTFVSWVVAGVIFGVVWPLFTGHFSVESALRTIVGITAVAGIVTAAIVFFSVENLWRQELPRFFPSGGL